MKFALQLGYWGAQPPTTHADLVVAADRAGFDTVFTERIRLSTAVVQLSARTPTATAMSTMTLDHLSGGRFCLGLGVSGPQVVEGWYGQPFSRPLARTREYIDIIRAVLRREAPVTSDGPAYALPYQGPGASGLGKPLKSPTDGSASWPRPARPTSSTRGSTRASPDPAHGGPGRTSRWRSCASST